MSEAGRIRKNTFYSLLSISSRLIANVVLFWVLARYYGPVLFGKFAFAHSLSYIFIVIADFGSDVLLTNEIAKNRAKADKIFQQFFSLKIVFTLLALIGMCLFALFENAASDSLMLIFVFSIFMVFTTLTNFMYALFKGFERLEYETKVSLLVNISLLVLTLILISIKANVFTIACAFLATRILGFAFGLKYSRVLFRNISFRLNYRGFDQIKSKVFIFGFNLVFNYLFFQMDTVLLAVWKGDYQVGIYQAVFKLILIPLVIPDILINTLLPVLSRLHVENIERWELVGKVMGKILLIVVIPISIIFFVFAGQIINIIYGAKNYSDAIPILRVFALTLFIRFNQEAYALMLTTSNKQHIRMRVVIFATILNFILNFFMIKYYGALGAALVSLSTNLVVGIIYYFSTFPLFFRWAVNKQTIVLLISSLILGYLGWLINGVTVILLAPLYIFIFAIIGLYYFLSNAEINLILPDGFKTTIFKNLTL